MGSRGAIREDSPVWLSALLLGHIGAYNVELPAEKRQEVVGCCSCNQYWWESVCCWGTSWIIHFSNLLTCCLCLPVMEGLNCLITGNDEYVQEQTFMQHVKRAIKDFIFDEFNVSTLQQAGQYLQRNFCTPISNLILKINQEEVVWTKDNLIPLLQLYANYVACDGGYGYQKNFAQHKYSEIREIVHNFIVKTICSSGNGNEELNAWLGKQLANWKKNPYSSLAGIGQYQIEIEFLLDMIDRIKAQGSVNISSNLQNIINIITNEVDLNKQKRELENQRRANINAAYMMGVEMRSGAGVY